VDLYVYAPISLFLLYFSSRQIPAFSSVQCKLQVIVNVKTEDMLEEEVMTHIKEASRNSNVVLRTHESTLVVYEYLKVALNPKQSLQPQHLDFTIRKVQETFLICKSPEIKF
jgi:hypothetical protein